MARTMQRTINREQRDALYAAMRYEVHDGDVLATDFPEGKIENVLRARQELLDAWALLDDIGWWPNDERETFELTMPDDALARVIGRVAKSTEGALRDYAKGIAAPLDPDESLEERREWVASGSDLADGDLEVLAACRTILGASA